MLLNPSRSSPVPRLNVLLVSLLTLLSRTTARRSPPFTRLTSCKFLDWIKKEDGHTNIDLDLPFYRKLADGLFLRTCRDVAKEYEHHGIQFNDMIVDNSKCGYVQRVSSGMDIYLYIHCSFHATCLSSSTIRCHGHAQLVW